MTKKELKQEAESKGIKYADNLEYTVPKFSAEQGYSWWQVEEAYQKGALDFAEPREKQIADLEEKLANANNQLEDRDLKIKKLKETYGKQRNKRIDELQKENAELKEKYIKNIIDCDICDTYCNSQLIKAKEILRDFISTAIDYIDKEDKNYSFIVEAEQFLKENE